jgi:hypothetical protein
MNTKAIGELSEAIVLAKFISLGWIVLHPFGDNQRYDLVIDRQNGFERVQVKTGKIKKGAIVFQTCSTYAHRGGTRKGYIGQIDLFAIYCPETGFVYLIKVDEFNMCGSLRIDDPKNKQNKGIKWAKDFKI